ncbi:hypothetical protein GH714_022571 [Hevea brasiliensis]|uniref:USP domain-containing protein n=1 Tax=Hevea brasiliensis TaxID=3981 RepID=A0A6A6KLA4_HEVBR|nr:hypothetical protein GH714_022571 [Hevea brasiliensis]
MGKKVKKRSRSLQKEKRVTAPSPKIAPQQINPSVDAIDDGVTVPKERKPCAHLNKGFNLNSLSEKLGSSDPLMCEDCNEGVADKRGVRGKANMARRKRQSIQNLSPNPFGTLIPVEKTEENGEKKDSLFDAVKLIKTRSLGKSSVDVENVWFGGGSVASEIKRRHSIKQLREKRPLHGMNKLRDFFLDQDASFGPLTIALKKLYDETKPETGLKNVINPRSFFGCICSKAPQFRGFQQQDSHELLRCLLDGLSSEELAVRKQINTLKDDEISLKHGPTFMDSLFGGQIASTVSCIECNHSSTVYEPFLDLSLPVPTKKPPTKKVQPVSRPKKTKLPPKRGGRMRGKADKDTDSVSAQSISDPSTSNEYSDRTHATVPHGENVVASSGDAAGSDSVCLPTVSDKSGLPSESFSAAPNIENEQAVEATLEQTAASYEDFTWMDYLEPETISDEHDFTSQSNDVSTSHYSGNMIPNDDLMEKSQVCSVDREPDLKPDSSSVNCWEAEVPLVVRSSEVLLLPYKEESFTDGEIIKVEAEASSSVVGCGQDEADFDGFGIYSTSLRVDEPSSTGYATVKDQPDYSQLSGNGAAEEDEDEEKTSRKVKVKRDATKRVLIDKAPRF